jgi:hypothetical protein
MTNKAMQYIVVQGRQPQDGSKPVEALVIFPAWVSATLVCAGMSGRVIELTDGSIKKSGRIPLGEDEMLTGLLIDEAANLESQQEAPSPVATLSVGVTTVRYEEDVQRIAELEGQLKIAQDNLEHTVNYMNEGCTCGRAPNPKMRPVPNPTPADYAELRGRVEELTDVNHQQQRELAAQDQELERLRTLLAGIRRLAKKGKK